MVGVEAGSPGRTRTYNLAVNSRSLYRLSYQGTLLSRRPAGFGWNAGIIAAEARKGNRLGLV